MKPLTSKSTPADWRKKFTSTSDSSPLNERRKKGTLMFRPPMCRVTELGKGSSARRVNPHEHQAEVNELSMKTPNNEAHECEHRTRVCTCRLATTRKPK